ncbi:helix-turn-helix domain-containing protein [Serratia marcescens]|uniref:helix-turn-helix domain-containing protein n=1 Tax=Serratia marcescens TaxID=615 RepID=UPI0034D2E8F0
MAHQADVNRTYVSKLEKCVPYVGLEIIGKFADVLGVDPSEFLKKPPRASKRKT